MRGAVFALAVALVSASGADASRLIATYRDASATPRDSLYEIDPTTAASTRIAGLPDRDWQGLAARSGDDTGVYSVSQLPGGLTESGESEDWISRIDVGSGAVSDLYTFFPGDFGFAPSIDVEFQGIAIDSSNPSLATIAAGALDFDTAVITTFLFDLNLDTGAISGQSPMHQFVMALAGAPDGTLYTIVEEEPRRLGVIDRASGTVSRIGSCFAATCTIRSMTFDRDGELYAIDVFGILARVSPITGETLQTIGPTGLGLPPNAGGAVSGMAFVPEPDTALLFALGLGALAHWRRARVRRDS